jgi:ABC-type nitrate/sulfonate/bicarbonate transport system substrate-binding protein
LKHLAATLTVVALAIGAPARAETDHITLAIPAQLVALLPLYIAQDTGMWESAGLDVKTVTIPSVGGMNAVIAGSADVSFSTGAAITRAAAHGQRLVAIAELGNETGQILILRKDLADAGGFDPAAPLSVRAKLLQGRTIAVGGIGSIADAFLKAIAREGGVAPSDVVAASMQAQEFLAAFAQKKIDGFVFGPPYAQQSVHDGTGVVIADGTLPIISTLSPSAAGLLVTRPGYCTDRRSVCEKLGHSMLQAVDEMNAHQPEAIAILQKRFNTVDAPVLAASFDAIRHMIPSPPVTSVSDLANSELINVQAGFLKPEEQLKSYDDLFDNQFVK